MLSRRTGLRIIGGLTLLLLLGLYGHGSWTRLLERHDIRQLSWQGASLSTAGIGLAQLSLEQHSGAGVAQLEIERLQLSWRQFGFAPPFWQHIELQRLTFDWQPKDAPTATVPSAPVDILQAAQNLAWLPHSLRIAQLHAELPCASGRCRLLGDLHLESNRQLPLQLDGALNLVHQGRQLSWQAALQGEPEALDLQLSLSIEQQPQLQLHSNLQNSASGPLWQGELSTLPLTQAAALQDWLRQWALAAAVQLPGAPGAAQLSACWQLQLPATEQGLALSLEQLRSADGQFAAAANLPEPWPIPGIGQAQGSFSVAARGQAGQWFAEQLQADLNLQQLSADWLALLPEGLRADALQLRIQPSAPLAALPQTLAMRSLPLTIQLSSKGATDIDVQATLALANAPPWAAQLQGRLQASSPALDLDGWSARQLKLDLHLDGYLDSERLNLDLGKGSSLRVDKLNGAELRLHQLHANIQGLQLQAEYPAGALQRLSISGPHELSVQRIEQQHLKPLGWRWQGQLIGDLQQLKLDGQISADADLLLHLQMQRNPAGDLQLQAQLPEVFLRAGNPLAKVLADWPALLDLNNGRLSASASLRQNAGSATPEVELEVAGKGVAGIYDRTLLNGLDTRVQLALKRNRLQLNFGELRLSEFNPGIALGPLQLGGSYSADLDQPTQGQLHIEQAQTALIGGNVTLAAGQWDLAQRPLLFPLQVKGLQLEQLFILYPTEGLAGSGTLDGELPLQLSSAGLQIDKGQLTARAPGGHLRFHSERIRALGRSNPAMQLVTQSLEDFQYDTLSSRVDYDQHGKLRLDLRLQGRNPAIEQGRPIHFKINLEEDIPTLLASLQLTDKVNEIITRRVQQRMLERNTAAPKAP